MYDGPEAHQALLEDSARCAAFADAIAAAAPLLKGRVVLDAGCGAGLLSLLLATEAGAAHVYAVDASAGACELARRVVKANGLEARVTVIHARIEAVSLPVDKVDAIVCDWMGAALLHDSLLPALAACRDRWLAPGGLMLPDVAALYVMGVDDRQHLADKRAFWHARQMVRPRLGWFVLSVPFCQPARRACLLPCAQATLLLQRTHAHKPLIHNITLFATRGRDRATLTSARCSTPSCATRARTPWRARAARRSPARRACWASTSTKRRRRT